MNHESRTQAYGSLVSWVLVIGGLSFAVASSTACTPSSEVDLAGSSASPDVHRYVVAPIPSAGA